MDNRGKSACPYCSFEFEEMPKRTRKCPACKEKVFLKRGPKEKEKRLVTEKEVAEIEKAWDKHYQQQEIRELMKDIKGLSSNEPNYAYMKDYYTAKIASIKQEYDKAWGLFNKARLEAASSDDFGTYRSITLDMAEQLEEEGKHKQALSMYCEIHYLDMCGLSSIDMVNSLVKLGSLESRYFGKPWGPDFQFLAPGIVWTTRNIIEKTGISQEEFRLIALRIFERIASAMNGPIAPNDALPILDEIGFGKKEPEKIEIPLF